RLEAALAFPDMEQRDPGLASQAAAALRLCYQSRKVPHWRIASPPVGDRNFPHTDRLVDDDDVIVDATSDRFRGYGKAADEHVRTEALLLQLAGLGQQRRQMARTDVGS